MAKLPLARHAGQIRTHDVRFDCWSVRDGRRQALTLVDDDGELLVMAEQPFGCDWRALFNAHYPTTLSLREKIALIKTMPRKATYRADIARGRTLFVPDDGDA